MELSAARYSSNKRGCILGEVARENAHVIAFVFLRRTNEREDHHVIEAVSFLKAWGVNARFVLLSKAEQADRSPHDKAVSQGFICSDRVKWLDGSADMCKMLKKVDLVCLPDDRWGDTPDAVAEIAAFGLPMVATNKLCGLQLVKHGYNGMLVPGKNPFALAESLFSMVRCSDRWSEIQKNAKETTTRVYRIGKKICNHNNASIFNY